MAGDKQELKLIDAEIGVCYVFHLSPIDYSRAMNDIQYCTQLLNSAKLDSQRQEEEESIVTENEPEGNEPTEESMDDAPNDGFRCISSAVQLLLTEYKNKETILHSGKVSVKKFWELISKEMHKKDHTITGPQCKSKFNGLKKTYKNLKDHNSKSGNNRKSWTYFEMMDEMFGNKPWANPILTLDSSKPILPLSSASSSSSASSTSSSNTNLHQERRKRQKVSHDSSTLEKLVDTIQENRTERKRMHEDAMSHQDRLLALLEKIAEK